MLHRLEIAAGILSQTQSTYLARISIDMARTSSDMDNIMRRLTALATVLMPLSIGAGVFGMNVEV